MRSLLWSDLEASWAMTVQLPGAPPADAERMPARLNREPEVLWHPDDGPELSIPDWGRPRLSEPCAAWL